MARWTIFDTEQLKSRAAFAASLAFLATSCSDGSHRGVRFFGVSDTYGALDAAAGSGALLRNLPGNPSNQKQLNIEVYGRRVTRYIFALVDGSEPCETASYSASRGIDTRITEEVSGDGMKRLCVKGAGEQLGYQTQPTEFVWEFDGTPPDTFDFVGLQSLVRNPPSSVTWSPSDGANTYRFQVSASASCDPNAGTSIPAANLQTPLGSLPDRIHYLCLSALDLAGNSTPATSSPFALKVDQTAPGRFHISSPLTVTNVQNPTISWTRPADASAISYRMELAINSSCQNPIESIGTQPQPHTSTNYTATQSLAEGRYYVCLTASDAVGNTVTAENSPYRFDVDTVSPLISFQNLPAANSNVTTLGIGVTSTSSDFYKFRYKIIAGTRDCAEVGSPYGEEVPANTVIRDSIAIVPDGLLRICVISRDVVGNWTAADKAQSYTWRKDTIAPTLSAVVPELCGPIICPEGSKLSISQINASDLGSGLSNLYLKLTAPDGQCFKQNLTGFEACPANSFIAVPGTPSTFDIPNDVFHNKNLRGVYEFSLKAVDQAGNEKTISRPIIWDNVAPVFSVIDGVTIRTRENQNYLVAPAPTKVNFLKVKLNANDSLSKIQKYCLKYFSASAPTPAIPTRTDGCWKVIPSTNQSQTLALNNLPLTVSFFPDTYKIFAWIMDAADNMSATSNFASVEYNPIKPPVFSHVYATYRPDDELPKTTNTMAPAGASRDVYIRWAVSTTNPNGLKSLPLSLMYTLDDEVYVAAGIAGFSPDARDPNTCKLSAVNSAATKAYAGCIKYTLPATVDRNKFLRFRIIAEDADGYITFAQTNALHLNKFTFLAGNTEAGLGSTALSAIINPKGTQNLAVHPSGQIFILDDRGLLFVDPLDGVLKVHPKSSSFRYANKIALDKNGDIVVLDGTTIKKLDLSTGSPTVTTIIGGGTDTSNTITDPLDLKINVSSDQIFFTAPNGDIYFMSESYSTRGANDPLRVRRAVFAQNYAIESMTISGSVPLFNAAATEGPAQYDLNECRLMSAAFTFDSSLETPTKMFPLIGPGSQTANLSSCGFNKPGNQFNQFYDYAPFKAAAITPFELKLDLSVNVPPFLVSSSNNQSGIREGSYVRYFQSLSGKLFARVNGVKDNNDSIVEFNGSTWIPIAGQGRGGECPDGTVATDCALNLSAIFVDSNDRVYMMDNDVVRVIQDDGKILTIAGETRSAGDGKNPLNARFNELTAFDIYPKTSSDPKFVISDAKAMKIREFSENGTIDSVAGNGIDAANPNLADFAKGHSLTWGDDAPNSGLVFDDSGNILVMKFQGQIPYKINKSTGKWESLTGSSSVPTIGGGYGAHVLGMNGSHVLFGTFNYLREQLAIGNGRLYVLPVPGTISQTISPIMSQPNASDFSNPQHQYKFDPQNMLCSSGTKRLECNGPYSSSAQLPQATFDAESSRWLLGINNLDSKSARIIGFQITANPNLDLVQDVLSLPTNRVKSFTIAGSLATDSKRAYVCLDSGSLVKYTISATGASVGEPVPFPVPGMKCSSVARAMIYGTQRRATDGGTLIFSYELNGLQGVAEIVNP